LLVTCDLTLLCHRERWSSPAASATGGEEIGVRLHYYDPERVMQPGLNYLLDWDFAPSPVDSYDHFDLHPSGSRDLSASRLICINSCLRPSGTMREFQPELPAMFSDLPRENPARYQSGRLEKRRGDPRVAQKDTRQETRDIGRLLEPQLPVLRRYARALTNDDSRADDLVQGCLVRALTNQHLFQNGSDLRSWLCAILHNLFISDVRRHTRDQKRLRTMSTKPALIPGSDPELSYRLREVQEALRRLPAGQRQTVLQVCLGSESQEDAASKLGIAVGTVRSRLGRARASLRAMTGYEQPWRPGKRRRGLERIHASRSPDHIGDAQ
jgi:RNA polymerase sigma-70 factor, ECF subfamily